MHWTGKGGGGTMVVILDSKYAYKDITEWSVNWRPHGWRVKNSGVGHRDL